MCPPDLWKCDNDHVFQCEEIVAERCQAGTHYRCPRCDTTNIVKMDSREAELYTRKQRAQA